MSSLSDEIMESFTYNIEEMQAYTRNACKQSFMKQADSQKEGKKTSIGITKSNVLSKVCK